jgi:L-arabinokinase
LENLKSGVVSDLEISASDFLPDAGRPWVLLSFTSLDLDFQALETICELSTDYEFFCVEPLHYEGSCIHSVSRNAAAFADILASCDIIISKPGFGLVSECIVNNKPLIYADRKNFAEYPYLVEGIEKYLKHVHIPSEQLYAGDFSESLQQIKNAPEPMEFIRRSGAEMIAEELLQRCR